MTGKYIYHVIKIKIKKLNNPLLLNSTPYISNPLTNQVQQLIIRGPLKTVSNVLLYEILINPNSQNEIKPSFTELNIYCIYPKQT